MSADAPDRDDALSDALDAVVRWRRCEEWLLPHRREPLRRERLWLPEGRWLADGEAGRGTLHRVGLDVQDRVRVVGPDRDPAGWRGDDVATVTWDGERSRVLLHAAAIDYAVDAAGRVVEARLSDHKGVNVERYERDDAGRVVTVHESAAMAWNLNLHHVSRFEDATVAVEHDERGPLRVSDPGGWAVWERCERPWAELLAEGARTIARLVVDGVERRVDQLGARGTEVYSLTLVYVDQGSLHIEPVSFGLEAERRELLRSERDPRKLTNGLFYTIRDSHGLDWVDLLDWDEEVDALLLREAALHELENSYTVVLDEVCRVLASHDWNGVVVPTDDFVVFCAEHDEGVEEKVRAIRAANPPARLAAWEAAMPARVERGDRYADLMPEAPDRVRR